MLNFVLEYVHSPSKCIIFALVFRKVKPILSIKHLNSLVSNDQTLRMTFRLLHLICNSQEHAKHFFNFMIDKETEKQHKSDKNHIPKQIEPSKDIPYAYVTFKHQDCILLGNHINSDESTPVLPTVLNQLQQQKSSIKKLIMLFNINHHTMIASHTHSNWITSKKSIFLMNLELIKQSFISIQQHYNIPCLYYEHHHFLNLHYLQVGHVQF